MDKDLMERASEIVGALRCDGTPEACAQRGTCPYHSTDYNHIGIGCGCDRERLDGDAAALIEEMAAEEPNDPLTLEELRGMDGEPVWAGNEKEPQHFQWFFVDCRSQYKPFILINRRNNLMWQYMKGPAHPGGWTAYRRKPEGGGE